jgi:hypothetical protein
LLQQLNVELKRVESREKEEEEERKDRETGDTAVVVPAEQNANTFTGINIICL